MPMRSPDREGMAMPASPLFGLAVAPVKALLPARGMCVWRLTAGLVANRYAMTASAASESRMPTDVAPVPPYLAMSFTFANGRAVASGKG
jgi:hypothetical protein